MTIVIKKQVSNDAKFTIYLYRSYRLHSNQNLKLHIPGKLYEQLLCHSFRFICYNRFPKIVRWMHWEADAIVDGHIFWDTLDIIVFVKVFIFLLQ